MTRFMKTLSCICVWIFPLWLAGNTQADVSKPTKIKPRPTPGDFMKVAVSDNFISILTNQSILTFNLSGPGISFPEATYKSDAGGDLMIFSEQNLFVRNNKGIHAIDMSLPAHPARKVHFISRLKTCDFLAATSELLYVATKKSHLCPENTNSLKIFDISDLNTISLISEKKLTSPERIVSSGNRVYICDGKNLSYLDTSVPTDIQLISETPSGDCRHLSVDSDTLILTSGTEIIFYDITQNEPAFLSKIKFKLP